MIINVNKSSTTFPLLFIVSKSFLYFQKSIISVILFFCESFNIFSKIKSFASDINRAYHIELSHHQPIQNVGIQIIFHLELIKAHQEFHHAIVVSVLIYL
ncbi:MAG: hypothetical protein Q8S84_02440 [bacterium]|nr:hypothetical protein [bacterium]MDP3380408.1 hypothetical protein [bacterium]